VEVSRADYKIRRVIIIKMDS